MKGSKLLFTISWVVLLLVVVLILLGAVTSVGQAYYGAEDQLTAEYSLANILESGGEDAAKAFRGRRATAATWAIAWGLLSAFIIWVPYRRREKWAWWALLVSMGVSQVMSLSRFVALGTTSGTSTAATILAFLLLGLMAGVPAMFSKSSPEV